MLNQNEVSIHPDAGVQNEDSNKKVSYSFEGADLIVKVDLNQDGKPALELKVDLLQIPAEVKALIK